MMWRGLRLIGLACCLLLLSSALFADYSISDSNFLRLKSLIADWLIKTGQASILLENSTAILTDSNLNLQQSEQTIKNLSGIILNLNGLLTLSESDLQKQKELLNQQSIAELWIAGGCVVGGIIIGILIRSLWS